ncbi:MAG: DUF192 domain-containing protein [Pseudomonadota bacterium]
MFARVEWAERAHGRGRPKLGICVGFLIGCATGVSACSENTVTLRTGDALSRFTVEVADDAVEQAQGLMFREELALGAGMLFVFDRPRATSFWMRNTLIPLDMIFIGADGVVDKVHANAVPLDETPIPGGDAIQFVLEINGGLAARLGIAEGTEVQHPAIAQASAAFPCE